MQGVQVVVDGDAADAHGVGDVLDGAAQDERTAVVEHPHGALLVVTGQRRQRAAELALDAVDQAVQRAVQRRHPHRGDHLALPPQGEVARLAVLAGDHRGPERLHDGMPWQAVHAGSRAAWRLTWVAPLTNAASTTAATTVAACSGATTHDEPNGPTSTVAPHCSAAAIAAVTWGPGLPSTNGSMVNSSSTAPTVAMRFERPSYPITWSRALLRLMQSVPAASNASFSLFRAVRNVVSQSLWNCCLAGPSQTVPPSAELTVLMIVLIEAIWLFIDWPSEASCSGLAPYRLTMVLLPEHPRMARSSPALSTAG